MQAIILAAGMGRRLGELTKNNTKCMVSVNGITLIDRMLSQLSSLNLSRVIIVIGYKGENLRKYIGNEYKGLKIEYIDNPVYDKTNNIYSLALAKKELQEDDTLLVESDLIFDDAMFPMIVNSPYPNLALVAKYESWMDGTMVYIDADNNITLNPQLHSRSATYIKRNGLLIRKITIKSSRPFQCAYHPLTP